MGWIIHPTSSNWHLVLFRLAGCAGAHPRVIWATSSLDCAEVSLSKAASRFLRNIKILIVTPDESISYIYIETQEKSDMKQYERFHTGRVLSCVLLSIQGPSKVEQSCASKLQVRQSSAATKIHLACSKRQAPAPPQLIR